MNTMDIHVISSWDDRAKLWGPTLSSQLGERSDGGMDWDPPNPCSAEPQGSALSRQVLDIIDTTITV